MGAARRLPTWLPLLGPRRPFALPRAVARTLARPSADPRLPSPSLRQHSSTSATPAVVAAAAVGPSQPSVHRQTFLRAAVGPTQPSILWQQPLAARKCTSFLAPWACYGSSLQQSWVASAAGGSSGEGPDAGEVEVELGISVQGDLSSALQGSGLALEALLEAVEEDAEMALREAVAMEGTGRDGNGVELSVVLCDDPTIAALNLEYRGKDSPTDVLSFEGLEDQPPGYPFLVLGDIVISADTARAQAEEQRCTLREEIRVLLVHGLFHLLGHDHELGEGEMLLMAKQEVECFQRLGWEGKGLIARCEEEGLLHGAEMEQPVPSGVGDQTGSPLESSEDDFDFDARKIKVLAIDMDGTLLNSSSKITERNADALRAALAVGVQVVLATGKARPAAIAALSKVDLAGSGLVVSTEQPGIFLQGLAVYGTTGKLLASPSLPVVILCFEHAMEEGLPLCAFLGDDCVTLEMTPELQELHSTFYEPLAKVVDSIEDILAGPPVKKLLFMTDPDTVKTELLPFLDAELEDSGAQVTQAVPNMLEVVPEGVNKWVGMTALLKDMGLKPENVMAIGDGLNDLELVENAGFGVAMANAVPQVLGSADAVSSSNDEEGVAEAIHKWLPTKR